MNKKDAGFLTFLLYGLIAIILGFGLVQSLMARKISVEAEDTGVCLDSDSSP